MAEVRQPRHDVVSFASEELILVNSQDEEIGYNNKAACHDGHGILHRAFSLFVFNSRGQLLLQQRSKDKRLWPGFWANSCCSHPRRGETMEVATSRRLAEELGMHCDNMQFVFKFEYQVDFGDLGAEHELCHVFVGHTDDEVKANRNEVEAWRFVSVAELDAEMTAHPEHLSPWLKLEWQRLRSQYNDVLPVAAG
ncbi:MAG TPA: isopentenyl-diphosphate Delta-isomerase [Rhodanobacteraceae bacterium]